MSLTRRKFIQISGASAAGLALSSCVSSGTKGFDIYKVKSHVSRMKTTNAKETTTICCYCAVGCGAIVHTKKGGDARLINIEGDPDHVINRGSLCTKGASLRQLAETDNRLTEPMYRAPNSDKWEKKSWDWMLSTIAKRVKETRDKTFTPKNTKGEVVNRTTSIASVGSAALDNEECWVYQTLMRSLGLVYVEHQARI